MHNHRQPTDWERMIEAARRMPVLEHYRPGRPFDVSESDVCAWLCDQPAVRQFVFNYAKRHQALVYVDKKWVGADTYATAKAP
jgi:hypothetical protein